MLSSPFFSSSTILSCSSRVSVPCFCPALLPSPLLSIFCRRLFLMSGRLNLLNLLNWSLGLWVVGSLSSWLGELLGEEREEVKEGLFRRLGRFGLEERRFFIKKLFYIKTKSFHIVSQ